jgi:hypothetical protein
VRDRSILSSQVRDLSLEDAQRWANHHAGCTVTIPGWRGVSGTIYPEWTALVIGSVCWGDAWNPGRPPGAVLLWRFSPADDTHLHPVEVWHASPFVTGAVWTAMPPDCGYMAGVTSSKVLEELLGVSRAPAGDVSRYPHTCLACKRPAYVALFGGRVDCSASDCVNFGRKA